MKSEKYCFRQIEMSEIQTVKELFISVFTIEPWNDDWSDKKQLDLYLFDLMGQRNSLTYGLFENDELIAVSMGYTKHWYTGTEYEKAKGPDIEMYYSTPDGKYFEEVWIPVSKVK